MRNSSPLIALFLIAGMLASDGFRDKGGPAPSRAEETCDQCLTRQKEICADSKSACVLKANAKNIALAAKCGTDEKCLAAAKQALDQEILACGEEEEECSSVGAARCWQCKQDTEREPCDACVSRHERICQYRERACKALNRAQYQIDLAQCAPGDSRCVRLSKRAYDESAMACVVGAQACSLGSTDGCSRCPFPPLRTRRTRPRAKQ